MKKPIQTVAVIIFLSLVFFAVPGSTAQAAIVPACGNNCELCHLFQTMANIMQFIVGIVGSLTLLMFVIGGFYWLISAGRSEYVNKGKSIIINAVIGLIIVMLSYSIITFVLVAFTGASSEQNLKIFSTPWAEFIDCS